jgi:N-acetylneuraminic acid mutarotase
MTISLAHRAGFWLLAGLALSAAACAPAYPPPHSLSAPGPAWRELAPLPTPRFLGPQVAALEGRLYVVGGLVRDSGRYYETGRLEVFDPRSGAWHERAPMPTARRDMVLVRVRGRLLAIGGDAGGRKLAVVEEYDARADHWRRRADMPGPRLHHAAAAVGGAVYVIGGRGTGSALARYDLDADRWTPLPDAPLPAENPYAVAVGGRIYVLGATDGRGGEDYARFQEYDPASGRWRALPPLPTPRTDVALASLGGMVFALGGWKPGGLTSAVDVYDPVTNRWATAPSLPRALSFAGAAVVGRELYLAGGAEYRAEALVPIASLLVTRPY